MARRNSEIPVHPQRGKLLCLIRHGKATPGHLELPDFERSLTPTGVRDCLKVAADLRDKGIRPDLIISSPADRALETAHLIADTLDYPRLQIAIATELYAATDLSRIIARLHGLDNRYSTVAVCGHNPTLDELAEYFLPRYTDSLSKGALIGIKFTVEHWSDIATQSGNPSFFLSPARTTHQTGVDRTRTK